MQKINSKAADEGVFIMEFLGKNLEFFIAVLCKTTKQSKKRSKAK
jgi:hypothetical protein